MRRKTKRPPLMIKTLTRWRISVVTAPWMVRHLSTIERLLKRGPVLVMYQGQPGLVAISLLDYARLCGGLGLPPPKLRKYRALMKLMHDELVATGQVPGRKRRPAKSGRDTRGR